MDHGGVTRILFHLLISKFALGLGVLLRKICLIDVKQSGTIP